MRTKKGGRGGSVQVRETHRHVKDVLQIRMVKDRDVDTANRLEKLLKKVTNTCGCAEEFRWEWKF